MTLVITTTLDHTQPSLSQLGPDPIVDQPARRTWDMSDTMHIPGPLLRPRGCPPVYLRVRLNWLVSYL